MKRIILSAALVAIVMSLVPQSADAQFFKKLGKALGEAAGITTESSSSTTDQRGNAVTKRVSESNESATADTADPAEKGKAKYQIHTTASTKTITVRGGADRLHQFSCGVAVVKYKNGWFVIDKQGNRLFDLPEDYVPVGADDPKNVKFDHDRMLIRKSVNYSGYDVKIIDKQGHIVKELGMANELWPFVDGVARLSVRKGFKTDEFYINTNGERIGTQTPFSKVYHLVNGVRCYQDPETKKWGYCDANMNIVLPAKFKDLGSPHNGLAQAQNTDDLWGFVNKQGAWVVKPQYSLPVGSFEGPYAIIIDRQGCTYYMDKSGKLVWQNPSPQETKITAFRPEGYSVWTMYNDSIAPAYAPMHIVDASFKKVGEIDRRYVEIDPSGEIVTSNAQWFQWHDSYGDHRLFDWKGNLLLEFNDLNNSVFSEGLCPTYQEYQYNCFYINERGEIIVKFEDTKF